VLGSVSKINDAYTGFTVLAATTAESTSVAPLMIPVEQFAPLVPYFVK
jgi:hypothetical protein